MLLLLDKHSRSYFLNPRSADTFDCYLTLILDLIQDLNVDSTIDMIMKLILEPVKWGLQVIPPCLQSIKFGSCHFESFSSHAFKWLSYLKYFKYLPNQGSEEASSLPQVVSFAEQKVSLCVQRVANLRFSHFYIFKNHDIVWELVLLSSINDCIRWKLNKLTSPSLQSQQPHFKQSSCQYISRAWKEDLWYIWRRSVIHLEDVFDTSKAPTTMYSFHLRWWWLWRWLWSPFNI